MKAYKKPTNATVKVLLGAGAGGYKTLAAPPATNASLGRNLDAFTHLLSVAILQNDFDGRLPL